MKEQPSDGKKRILARGLLIAGLIAVVVWTCLLNLLPPLEKDALYYHLAFPKIWLEAGRFVETPWAESSYYPMNIQLLFLVPLAWGADVGAKYIHFAFGLATALLIYLYLRARFSVEWGLWGALCFLSAPAVMRLGASAYVDLGLTFFILAAVLALIRWHDRQKNRYFFLSAALLGLALGVKYNALLALPLLGLGAFWLKRRQAGGLAAPAGWAAGYVLVALLVFSPWMIKNYLLTGNPLFPLMADLMGRELVFAERRTISSFLLRKVAYGESFWETLLVPVRFFFQGQDFSGRYFDGVLNPWLFFLPFLALIKPSRWEIRPLFLLAWLLIVLVVLTTKHTLIRFAAPSIAILAMLAAVGLKRLTDQASQGRRPWAGWVVAGGVSAAVFAVNADYAVDFWRMRDPGPYLTGKMTRRQYLTAHLPTYATVDRINRKAPENARVLLLYTGNRGYYLDRAYIHGSLMSGDVLGQALAGAEAPEDVFTYLKEEMGVTHVMARLDLLEKYLSNLPAEKAEMIKKMIDAHWRLVYRRGVYAVFELQERPS